MKSKGLPQASPLKLNPAAHSNVTRRARLGASAAVAAALLCLSLFPFAGAASSAGAGPRQKKAKPAAPAPQNPPAPAEAPAPAARPAAGAQDDEAKAVRSRRVKLFYLRAASDIAAALTEVAKAGDSPLEGFAVKAVGADELVIAGTRKQRQIAGVLIATLDLPRPGVQMEMWGVQLSSKRPGDLAEVMRHVRAEIERTQRDVRATYAKMQEFAGDIQDFDPDFEKILVKDLRYKDALDANRSLSFSDILLRLIAARDPVGEAEKMAEKLDTFLAERLAWRDSHKPKIATKQCKPKSPEVGQPKTSFENFFTTRGLDKSHGHWTRRAPRADGRDFVIENTKVGKAALLDFAMHYERLIHDEDKVDPYHLQQATGALNTRLQLNIDALNKDMQEVFVVPTLDRIRVIASQFCDVEYAQIGRTTVASLSGSQAIVTAGSVNTFDFVKPLTLTDFLGNAKTLTDAAKPLVPGPATTNLLGTVPFAEVVGLIGALGADRTQTRKTTTEMAVTITPNVLRDMISAELDVDLKTGDPLAGGTQQEGTPQFTRVSDHDVKTKVYVNALDFFDLSAFGSQATMNGGRGYVPIIGPLWRGLFGEAPVIGELLSWKKKPKTVYSQSLALTTSFITPTAMGVALLVPTERIPKKEDCPERAANLESEIKNYKEGLFSLEKKQSVGEPCPKQD